MSVSDPTETVIRRARRRHTWQLISTSVTVFLVLSVMAALEEGRLDGGGLAVRLAVTAAALTVVTLVLFGLRRAGARWLQPAPAMGLDRAERRAIARALRPGGVVAPEHRASTVAVARDLTRYRWAPWFFLAVGAVNGLFAVTEPGGVRWVHAVGCVIGFLFTGYYVVALRRARAIRAGDAGSARPAAGDADPS
jgi:hypothetical protein